MEANRYLDFFGGMVTTLVGHWFPRPSQPSGSRPAKVLHTSTLYLAEPAIEPAELTASPSGIPDAKVLLTTSGSEAAEAAFPTSGAERSSSATR